MYDNIMKDIQLRLCEREEEESKSGFFAIGLSLTDQGHGVAGQTCYHATEQYASLYSISKD
jgi:hypothetical protein